MNRTSLFALIILSLAAISLCANAAEFQLVVGIDERLWPGTDRAMGSGTFRDGDRLAGTSDTGVTVDYRGTGSPLFEPNHVGAMSFLYRRASVLAIIPLQGVDFLGGPLLDLDGDLNNGTRSLIPVLGQTPVVIPATSSHIDLEFDFDAGEVLLTGMDMTGTNEGGPGITPGVATTLTTLAGTTPSGGDGGERPNLAYDTRLGTLTPHATLPGVYQIDGLQVEYWYDSVESNSATAAQLGTFQQFATMRGWLVVRDCGTGTFPTLSGAGLGSTLWPQVDTSQIGQAFNVPASLGGGTRTIAAGIGSDDFTLPGNGGLALVDFGGDIGGYFDNVVVPQLDPDAEAFVFLEGAGFGLNNSSDPIYGSTVGYDIVIIAQTDSINSTLVGDIDGNGSITSDDAAALVDALLDPSSLSPCEQSRADVKTDGFLDGKDVAAFVAAAI